MKINQVMIWIVGVIFATGMLYANIVKIPTIEKCVVDLTTRVSVSETHYGHIKDSLDRIERKLK